MLENSSIVEERRRRGVCLRERTPYLAQINIRIKILLLELYVS